MGKRNPEYLRQDVRDEIQDGTLRVSGLQRCYLFRDK